MSKVNVELPTRDNIRKLLRELSERETLRDNCPSYEKMQEYEKKCRELHEKLLDNPKLHALEKTRKKYYESLFREEEEYRQKVAKLRRMFFARGLTPKVLAAVQAFVEEINKK